MANSTLPYRGRFAPSPTGPLHLGSLFTALASFLQARSLNGKWLVRIDDLDPLRCKAHFSKQILTTLENYGLHWDEGVVHQSKRSSAYQNALEILSRQNLTYDCVCSRKQLEERYTGESRLTYDGYCLKNPATASKASAIRIKVGQNTIQLNDLTQGAVSQNLSDKVGDFIVLRKDKAFAYHLAVAVDDNDQNISEVLRGIDLLDSTPRQVYLQQRLELKTPAYAHIPVLVDSHHAKLSKQTFAADASEMPINATLIKLLHYLQLSPPVDLVSSPKHDILSWAIEHWQLDNLKKRTSIVVSTH
ncbi:MAG: hypothetical protein A6F71_08990 [Cycloclasticus sp. symbiont of Poecilosclerida sp. M]|nr:MAG: hypothetical protein A6F71_08990 [Cycloclasticus sp. symbiont of Poecilosclerida sp. M]